MRARRALLYMPGDDLHKIRKAAALDLDCACLDLEDGVALNRKAAARAVVAAALQDLDFGRTERLARINPVGSGLERADLAALLPAHPDGIVIPKVQDGDQVRWVSEEITAYERRHGWPLNGIGLLVLVETARGIVRLPEIAAASPRLQALIFGSEDLAGDIGATRTPEGWEIFYARSAVVTHAAACELQALDGVYVDFKDTDGLSREARQGAGMGFTGKQIIHPAQVEPVQAAFTPEEAAVAHALRLVQAAQEHQAAGRGAFAFDGKMVDAPIIKAAERVLQRARAAGKLDSRL